MRRWHHCTRAALSIRAPPPVMPNRRSRYPHRPVPCNEARSVVPLSSLSVGCFSGAYSFFFFSLVCVFFNTRNPLCAHRRHPSSLSPPLSRKFPTIPLRKRHRAVARTTTNAVTLIIPDKGLSSSSSLSSSPVKQNRSSSSSSSSNSSTSSSTGSHRRRRRRHTPYTTIAAAVANNSATLTAAQAPALTTTTTTITTTVQSTAAGMETQDTSMTNLIINYLPQSMTDKKLHQMFTQIGQIEACRVMKDVKTGYSFGFGFVNFVRPEDASRAIEVMNGLQVENKRLKVSYARPAGEDIKDTNLYVQNLPRSITERELEDLFAPYGQIVQKNILKDKYSGLPRGVAFVRYNKKEDAQKAINQLNGVLLEGCTEHLSVKIAEEHGKQKAAYLAGLQTGLAHRGTNDTLTYLSY